MTIMDTLCKKWLLTVCVIVCSNTLTAQEKVSKTITETYALTNTGEFHLNNKYGDVTINGWDKNSLVVTMDITATHKKKEYAENLLERINPEVKELSGLVSITSEISEKSTNFFARYFNKVNPFDFDRSNIQINYTVYLPSNAELEITNVFGDVIIEDWNGKLKGDIQHGDVWINKDLNNADITVRYGKLRAKSINYGNIRLKNGSMDLSESRDLRINSSGTTIAIEKVSSLEIYSSKDEIRIEELGSVYGELQFTNMQSKMVSGVIDLSMKIADFKVAKISAPTVGISLDQESSEISLNIAGLAFKFDATLEQGLLRLPKSFENVNSEIIDKGRRIREITASYGDNPEGKISIRGKKGVVLLKEL